MENASTIVVLISGNGTNLQAIIDATNDGTLPCRISCVISNNPKAYGLIRATNAFIPTITMEWDRSTESRSEYDAKLVHACKQSHPDLIVLAGWMHLLSRTFLLAFSSERIINLHPALPDAYPGSHAIEDAWNDHEAPFSGAMVHEVVSEMDAGRPLTTAIAPKFRGDSFDSFQNRIRSVEKPLLIQAILMKLAGTTPHYATLGAVPILLHRGKVRNIYDLQDGRLMIETSDRCSSFDRHICDIPGKGLTLSLLNAWWMKQTAHIIPNHFLMQLDSTAVTIVKKCKVFPIEFVVRGWLTGSTQTSIWHHYQQGERCFGDLVLQDGLSKNTPLPHPILTPTTKSAEHDEPISGEEIIQRGIMSESDFNVCRTAALKLFEYGTAVALEKGFILADTKYEFGIDPLTGKPILVDEMHTPDSSRFWVAEGFREGQEPRRFDKDLIRCYIKERCDPYKVETLPIVDPVYVASVSANYREFWEKITQQE